MSSETVEDRRPIQARETPWARRLARILAHAGLTPNQISVASVLFALLGTIAMVKGGIIGYIAAAICIQLRLLCNLFDGMVAVEHNKQTPLGGIFNEFPDRVADSLLIVGAGYAAGYPSLGWAGALFAALTAYVRVFGASCGLGHDFRGPMAKQHRMAVLTVALVLQAIWPAFPILLIALAIIAVGAVLTCGTRTYAMAKGLIGKGAQ